MHFKMPVYTHPDFTQSIFQNAPDVKVSPVQIDGTAPEGFHSTSMFPEYYKVKGKWILAKESRMDSCVVLRDDGELDVVEARNLKKGDMVILGRSERCEEGIYLHCNGFHVEGEENDDQFVFRQGRSRILALPASMLSANS